MAYYIPVIGALALAVGTLLERVVLKKKKIDIKLYQAFSFFTIVLVMLPLIYFFWHISPEAFTYKNTAILLVVIFFSTIANLLIFYSLKWEKVSILEPARVLEPLFVIFLAIIFSFFTQGLYERNTNIVIPAVVASLALILSHVKKDRLEFNKYFVAAVLGSFFFALELVISRLILDFYSPLSFYFVRSFAIFLVSFLLFKPKFGNIDEKTGSIIFLTGAVWVVYRLVLYYGYLRLGVIFTTLVIMLGPIFIYILAGIFLKEKIDWRNLSSAAIIGASIVYAIFNG